MGGGKSMGEILQGILGAGEVAGGAFTGNPLLIAGGVGTLGGMASQMASPSGPSTPKAAAPMAPPPSPALAAPPKPVTPSPSSASFQPAVTAGGAPPPSLAGGAPPGGMPGGAGGILQDPQMRQRLLALMQQHGAA